MISVGLNCRRNAPTTNATRMAPSPTSYSQVPHGIADIRGLVADQRHFGGLGDVAAGFHVGNLGRDPFVDAVHDGDRVLTRLAEQWAVDATIAVDADDVVLNGRIVFGVADVANEDRPAVANGDWDVIDVVGRGQRIERVNLVLRRPEFDRSGSITPSSNHGVP